MNRKENVVFLSLFKVRMKIQDSLIREERDKDIIPVKSAEIN